MLNIYNECTAIIKELVGADYLYFDTSVEVKTTPHSHPFHAWAACVSPNSELHVMDSDEQWHLFQESDMNAGLLIGSLYQRIKGMQKDYQLQGEVANA